MLLYWDQISTIVPSEYVYDRRKLLPHMSTLIEEGLVDFIEPQKFIENKNEFGKPFIGFVKRRFRVGRIPFGENTAHRFHVHVEKLGPIADELVSMNLATRAEYPWYEMDPWVANAFMAYLACLVGSIPEIASAPITNDVECFRILAGYQGRAYPERIRQRQIILGEIFPFPKAELSLNKVIKFKQKYGAELTRFRNKIEGMCIYLSNIPLRDREEQRQIKTQELKDDMDLVANHMKETWHQITFLDVFPVLSVTGSVIAGLQGHQTLAVGAGALSLSTAIYRYIELKSDRGFLIKEPLAYGALLNREWPRLRDSRRV